MRHILVVESPYRWHIEHPKGFGDGATTPRDDALDCARLQAAADTFMDPPPLRPAARLRDRIRRVMGWEALPVKPGAYWIELVDGNMAIGGRLEPALEVVHTGRLR